jgi:hypothetical protein
MKLNKKTLIISFFFIAVLLISAFSVREILTEVYERNYRLLTQQAFDKAFNEVEQIRNVTLPHVDLEVVTRQWAIDTWGKGYAPDMQKILRDENIYKGLFMITESTSLYSANVDWAGTFGAASWNDKIYVVQENFDPSKDPDAEATFVHELTHIMQNQFPRATTFTFDSDKALTALIEGDASYMSAFFINQTKGSDNNIKPFAIEQVPAFLIENSMLNELHPDLPQSISCLNYFPYGYGKIFINSLYQKGGWETVNQAYSNPPNTTEQIMYPDKYFAGESSQQVATPALADKDWTKISENTYGEYFIQVMLGTWLSKTEAETAAAGWNGDTLTYYERENDFLFTWNIKWDSSSDASDFSVAFHNLATATGAEGDDSNNLFANGRYLMIEWNQITNTTLIACSNNQTATLQSYFS